MSTSALFIDLPNFYSRLLKSGIAEPRLLKEYFLNWLNFSVLSQELTDSFIGIWAFYSGERLGPSSERITGQYLKDYIDKINSYRGVTALDVNIPGQQRESVEYECENCKHKGISESKSEKGIDASLTVHLFDTMESWDMAYLLSGDADFVPAVNSLRRRGKIVIGAGFADASPALIRECYDYIDLGKEYIKEDVGAYLMVRKDGVIDKFLGSEIMPEENFKGRVILSVGWFPKRKYVSSGGDRSVPLPIGDIINYQFFLKIDAATPVRAPNLDNILVEFQKQYPGLLKLNKTGNNDWTCNIKSKGVTKVIDEQFSKLMSSHNNLSTSSTISGGLIYRKIYDFNDKDNTYHAVDEEKNE